MEADLSPQPYPSLAPAVAAAEQQRAATSSNDPPRTSGRTERRPDPRGSAVHRRARGVASDVRRCALRGCGRLLVGRYVRYDRNNHIAMQFAFKFHESLNQFVREQQSFW